MNILQVTSKWIMPQKGGLESAVYKISIALANRGHKVVVLSPHKCKKVYYEKNVKYQTIPVYFNLYRLTLIKLNAIKEILNIIKWADIIHIHSTHELFNFFIFFFSKLLKKKTFVVTLSPLRFFDRKNFIEKIYMFIIELFSLVIILRSDIVQVKNIGDFQTLKKLNLKKLYLIPDGIDDIFFKYAKIQEENYSKNKIKILYIGRIDNNKGIEHFIIAIKKLSSMYEIEGIIISRDIEKKGYLLNLLKKHSAENLIRIKFSVSEIEKVKLIDQAKVIVIPSLYDFVEGFSIVASEAWSRGKPVVAYAVGSLKFRIKNGFNGYLANKRNINSLIKALINSFKISKVITRPDVVPWEDVVKRIEKLYMM
jgi:glycosyltransferase involved in cell wall biosynthesis